MEQPTTVERILRSRELRLEFQPVVDLGTGTVVGFEELMRGPSGPLGSPDALITAAEDEGVLEDLDRLARFSTLFAAGRAQALRGRTLFLNSECCGAGDRFRTELETLDEMAPETQLVLEVSERAARRDRDTLTTTTQIARTFGWLVSLDNVGPDHPAPGLMSVLRPDIVKLDRRIIGRGSPRAGSDAALGAVRAYVEESSAILVAQGIETPGHRHAALALGAAWGQGWLLGRPSPVPDDTTITSAASRPQPSRCSAGPSVRVSW